MSDDARRNGDAKPDATVAPVAASPSASGSSGSSSAVDASGVAEASVTATQITPAKPSTKELPKDVVLIGPPTADGAGLHVIRARQERIETGELRALEEGKPIVGEVVTLKPREENPRICDVTQSYAPPTTTTSQPSAQLAHKGPAKVASPAYREGWDEIFGKKPPPPSSTLN